jgi:hypothetical protein
MEKITSYSFGRITQLYRMNDEENRNHAILIENDKLKKAWHVPLYFEPEEKLLNAEVVCGLKTNQRIVGSSNFSQAVELHWAPGRPKYPVTQEIFFTICNYLHIDVTRR